MEGVILISLVIQACKEIGSWEHITLKVGINEIK